MRARWYPPRQLLAALLAIVVWQTGCAGFGVRPAGAPSSERPFLLSPLEGWKGELSSDLSLWIYQQHRDLVERGAEVEVLDQALEMLERLPDFAPARVLEAQVRYLSGRYTLVAEALAPVVERYPEYVAAQVLLGRAAERSGRVEEAARSYAAVADRSGIAARRLEALAEPLLVELEERFDEAMAAGRGDAAAAALEEMAALEPDGERVQTARRRLAELTADPARRLSLLREIAPTAAADPETVRRRVELELEIGDVATAVDLAEALLDEYPADPGLEDLLARARFQWRLDLLPGEVGGLTRRAELTRGEYAVMLYWLFPGVRYGRPSEARIATDVIDDPRRTEIVRVINLGLMEIDRTLHRFYPQAPLTRRGALRALLELLAGSGADVCLEPTGVVPASSPEMCAAAARCGLLVEAAECLPEAGVSGVEAVELIRRAQAALGPAP